VIDDLLFVEMVLLVLYCVGSVRIVQGIGAGVDVGTGKT